MQRFFYGTFETILYAHVAEISRKDLADILFSSTDIDPKADDAKIQRKDCIDSSLLTRFRSGERKVSPAILEKYRSPSARENVIFWFQTEIVPKIVEFESEPLVQELLTLIQRDPFTDEETYVYCLDLSTKIVAEDPQESFFLGDFLAEVYMFAIQQDPCLKRIHNLPTKNRFFYGRKSLLSEIENGYKMGVPIQGLFGLAGVGKTQIALQYAQIHAEEYTVVCWINAGTILSIEKSIFEFLSMYENLSSKKVDNNLLSAFSDFFKNKKKYLIIYDNAEYANKAELLALKQYLPEDISKGNILITTRCRHPFEGSHQIEVKTLEQMEAVQFLQSRSGLDDISNAKIVTERLGYHPLALEYAAAYIRETPGVDYVSYTKKLDRYGVKVLDYKVGDLAYKDTIREAFHVSLDKILEDVNINLETRSIEQFLKICAYLYPDEIRMDIFRKFGFVFPKPLSLTLCHELKCDALLRNLVKYSLLQVNNNVFALHRLLQEVLYDEMTIEDKLQWPMWTYAMFTLLRMKLKTMPKEAAYPICIMIALHVRNILSKYTVDYQNSDTPNAFICGCISREYANCVGWLIRDYKKLENNIPTVDNYRQDALILQEAIRFYELSRLDEDIYFAWIVYLLAQTNESLGNEQGVLDQYNKAIYISNKVVKSLMQEREFYSCSFDELATRLPKTEKILAEQAQIAARIYHGTGFSQVAAEHMEFVWQSFAGLKNIIQFERFFHRKDGAFLKETEEDLSEICKHITARTNRAFVLQLNIPNMSTHKQSIQIRSRTFGFFFPPEDISVPNPSSLVEGFDIILDIMNEKELTAILNTNWGTLAFGGEVRTLDDILNGLMNMDSKRLSIPARHSLYSAIYALAKNFQREDIMKRYSKKAERLGNT